MPSTIGNDPRNHVILSKDQFDKIVELLTPGYELSKMFMQRELAAAEERASQVEAGVAPANTGIVPPAVEKVAEDKPDDLGGTD